MKKFILFSVCLFLMFEAVRAEKYHEHDSTMLAIFMQQEMMSEDGITRSNAQILLSTDYTDNWKTNPGWIGNISSHVIEWVPGDNGKRIKSINTPATTSGTIFLSGAFNFSGCENLTDVSMVMQQLSSADFTGCTKLETVDMAENKLKSVNFTGCENLRSVNLNVNNLLFSKITLPNTGISDIGVSGQDVEDVPWTVKWINNELFFVVDLSAERLFNGYPILYAWEDLHPDSDYNGIFYFAFERVQAYQASDVFWCHMVLDGFVGSPQTVKCAFRFNNMGQVSVTAEPVTTPPGTAYFYLKQENDFILVGKMPCLGTSSYSNYLPQGEYFVGIDAPGYLFSYYSAGSSTAVTDWKQATPYLVNSGNHDLFVKLSEQQASSVNDDVTISGIVKESASAGGASRKPTARPFRNATVLLHSPTNLKATVPVGWYLVRTVKPDEETGAYEFKNLPAGIYHVSVDIPGYQSNGESIEVVTVAGETYTYKNFIVNETAKTVVADDVTYTPLVGDVQLTVYPNPVTDVLRVSGLEGSYTVKILDVLGRVVTSGKGTTPELELNLAGKPSGMYMVRIESQGKVITRKVIKK